MEEQHSPDYRTVAVFWNVAEAELARGLLEADGIGAALLDAADAALLPGAKHVQVLVPAADLTRAREILAGGPSLEPVADAPGDAPDDAPEPLTPVWRAAGWIALAVLAATAIARVLVP